MKKEYEAPVLEVEEYMLNTSIATMCELKLNQGPGLGKHDQCSDWGGTWEVSIVDGDTKTSFYDDTTSVCTCYYTASNNGTFAS